MVVARLAVVLASAGRPEILAEALDCCSHQRGVSFTGVVSVPDERSLPADRSLLTGWQLVQGTRGLAAQRNAGLDTLQDAGTPVDVVAFFDDDAVPRSDYLANALRFFEAHPGVLGLTGRVLLDGATSGEIDRQAADKAITASTNEPSSGCWRPSRTLYGCNFVVKVSGAPDLRFDERLPLYSWLEDHDFARRLNRRGLLAAVDECVIVHRAATSGGRQAHVRLGYSQVMNPVYLAQKGSFPAWLAAQQILRPVTKNVLLSAVGPSTAWRRERLRGNGAAVRDIISGRITPERITEL